MRQEEKRFVQASAILSRSVSSEVLLAAPDTEDFDVLSGTGSVVWRLLDVPRTLDEITDRLTELYSAPRDAIARDSEELVRHLRERGWVEAEDG
ncbi:MAG: PqqD family protein [Actinomycetota bacterium]